MEISREYRSHYSRNDSGSVGTAGEANERWPRWYSSGNLLMVNTEENIPLLLTSMHWNVTPKSTDVTSLKQWRERNNGRRLSVVSDLDRADDDDDDDELMIVSEIPVEHLSEGRHTD